MLAKDQEGYPRTVSQLSNKKDLGRIYQVDTYLIPKRDTRILFREIM